MTSSAARAFDKLKAINMTPNKAALEKNSAMCRLLANFILLFIFTEKADVESLRKYITKIEYVDGYGAIRSGRPANYRTSAARSGRDAAGRHRGWRWLSGSAPGSTSRRPPGGGLP